MAATARMHVEPELLEWACERAGHDVAAFAARFPKLIAWLAREESPTFKQLEDFAKVTHTPLGYLFLPSPPEEQLPIPDFRTVSAGRGRPPSPNLLDTVYAMQRRQEWLRETLIESGADRLGFVGSAKLRDAAETVAEKMRSALGVKDGWASLVSNWQEAISELRRRIERIGVMAVINGVVANNTSRPLDVLEFRGFAISDAYAPLIFVNGADSKAAQMFTLAHEMAHLWLGTAGISGFETLLPRDSNIETWCDGVAAEFLVPAKELKALWKEAKGQGSPFDALARHFKVSPIVAARRALDLRLLGRDAFFSFYRAYIRHEHNKKQDSEGGNFYNSQNTRVGQLFATHVLRAATEGRIGFKEAYDLTDLHGGAFQEYAARLGIAL